MKSRKTSATALFFALACVFFLAVAWKTSPYRALRPALPAIAEKYIAGEHVRSHDGSHWLIKIPAHNSGLEADYWIDQIPVTMSAYLKCVDAEQCPPTHHRGYFRRYVDELIYRLNPVSYISWREADQYCAWLGGSLPTEAQWRAAAGNGRYPWGDQEPNLTLANFDGYYQGLTPAGWLPLGASPYGVLDMAGNVREWVLDEYAEQGVIKPAGDTDRVLKGGSSSDFATTLENDNVQWHSQNSAGFNRGFRCVYSSP